MLNQTELMDIIVIVLCFEMPGHGVSTIHAVIYASKESCKLCNETKRKRKKKKKNGKKRQHHLGEKKKDPSQRIRIVSSPTAHVQLRLLNV